jgi:ABC-2 type transport system ATP-binding protein
VVERHGSGRVIADIRFASQAPTSRSSRRRRTIVHRDCLTLIPTQFMALQPTGSHARAIFEAHALTKIYQMGEVLVQALRGVDLELRSVPGVGAHAWSGRQRHLSQERWIVQMPPIITTDALTRRYGKSVAVDRATLSIAAGEVFGLLGRNAAGKSTLIKMLTTLLPPSSGSARVAGFDIVEDASRVRRVIGYVPQALSADGELTGYENLNVFARLYDLPRGERGPRIREGLAFMDLSDAADRLVGTYSGGMIRRLEIAQSMLHRPQVLFLDEPTVGLDPVARDAVWRHVERLRIEYGMTIFLTTHYMEEAERLCTRVAIMQQGAIVVQGTLAELRATLPLHGDTAISLDEVFARYTEKQGDSRGDYDETADSRRAAKRLG